MKIACQVLALLLSVSLIACSGRKVPAPVEELYQGKTFRDVRKQSFSGQHYTVQKGDTLFLIAWRTGQDYLQVAKLNRIPAPYKIYPGQRLSLPTPARLSSRTIHKATGQSSKVKANQVVDHQKKQAYGKTESVDKKRAFVPPNSGFPDKIESWLWPTRNSVTRGFSSAEQGNKGLDFSGTLGSPILVTAAGKVVYTGDALRGYGKLVIVKHSDSFLSAYAHNDRILVKEQQWVRAGQKIATMGKSGSERVKLHFEVRYKGKSVDPLRYLPKR